MQWVRNHREILFLWLLFIFSRLVFLGRFPIFNDEAIIIYLSRVVFVNPSHWILLAFDGRQPLYGLTIALGQFLPVAPLVGARLTMVAWSLVTFGVSLVLAREIGLSPRAQRFYALFLIVCPYLLFYDRMALPESPIVALSTLAILVTIKMIRGPSVWRGILLGTTIAIGWWYFSLVLLFLPAILILLIFYGFRSRSRRWPLIHALLAGGIVYIGSVVPVLLQEHYWKVITEESSRFFSVQELLSFPIFLWFGTMSNTIGWVIAYATPFAFLLVVSGSIVFFRTFGVRVMLLCILVPILLSVVFVSTLSARNLVVLVPFYLLLAAFGMQKKNLLTTVLGSAALGMMAVMSGVLIVSPPLYYQLLGYIPAAQKDFYQYVGGWTSGYGVASAAAYLTEIAQSSDIIVLTRYDSGNPEDGIRALIRNSRVRITYLSEAGWKQGMYFVSRGPELMGLEPYLTPLAKFTKPVGGEYVGVYQFRWD